LWRFKREAVVEIPALDEGRKPCAMLAVLHECSAAPSEERIAAGLAMGDGDAKPYVSLALRAG
jgi:hypothetical protein